MKITSPAIGSVYEIASVVNTKKTKHAHFWTATVTATQGKKIVTMGINCSERPEVGKSYAAFKLKPGIFIETFGAKFTQQVRMMQPAAFVS